MTYAGWFMLGRNPFDRIVASLHEAALDDSRWATTSALIDEACGIEGNCIAIGEGPPDDVRVNCVGLHYRGQRREDLEREYLELYHPTDEGVARGRRARDSHIATIASLYTDRELKTSDAYNVALPRGHFQNGLHVRMDLSMGSFLSWRLGDPVTSGGWATSRLALVEGLLPHIRQFVRVRRALARAGAQVASVTDLLENTGLGVIHLDQRGRVVAANDRAQALLRRAGGVSNRDGVLRIPNNQARLERLIAGALPVAGVAVGGSMSVPRNAGTLPLVLHVRPAPLAQPTYGLRSVAVVVLLVEPGRQSRIDPAMVASSLGLTAMESRIATWLAEGRTVAEIAAATGRKANSVRWHLKQIYRKRGLSGQADLVRLVLSAVRFS